MDEWISFSLSDEQANEMSDILTKVKSKTLSGESPVTHSNPKAFKGRLLEVIDQAQHFAALGQAGTGGSLLGNSAQSFREGLDITERDREEFSSNNCFFLTEERKSSRWHRRVPNEQRDGTRTAIADDIERCYYVLLYSSFLSSSSAVL